MSEQAPDARPAKSPLARLVGVIISPVEAFEDVIRRPGWLFPLACYAAVFLLAFGVYAMKADWIAIVTDQLENNPILKMVPEGARDQALREATDQIRGQTQVQRAAENVANVLAFGFLPWYHGMAVLYATLFVLMGSLPTLRLGAAWLWFVVMSLICFLVLGGVSFIGRAVFADAPESRLLLVGAAAIVVAGAWAWLLDQRARSDPALHQVLSVCTYSSAVAMVGALAMLAISLGAGEAITTPPERIVKSNLASLLQPEAPVAKAVLRSLDVFALWTLTVLTLGFRAVAKLSAGVTASITFLPWVVWVLVKVAFASAFG